MYSENPSVPGHGHSRNWNCRKGKTRSVLREKGRLPSSIGRDAYEPVSSFCGRTVILSSPSVAAFHHGGEGAGGCGEYRQPDPLCPVQPSLSFCDPADGFDHRL